MSFSLATSAAAYICVRDCMWVVSSSIFGLAAERGSTDRLDTTGKDVQSNITIPQTVMPCRVNAAESPQTSTVVSTTVTTNIQSTALYTEDES